MCRIRLFTSIVCGEPVARRRQCLTQWWQCRVWERWNDLSRGVFHQWRYAGNGLRETFQRMSVREHCSRNAWIYFVFFLFSKLAEFSINIEISTFRAERAGTHTQRSWIATWNSWHFYITLVMQSIRLLSVRRCSHGVHVTLSPRWSSDRCVFAVPQ